MAKKTAAAAKAAPPDVAAHTEPTAPGQAMSVSLTELEHDPVSVSGREHRLEQVDDLLASIPVHGIIQSLRVRDWTGERNEFGLPRYAVVGGNRRLHALRTLQRTGVPVLGQAVESLSIPVVYGDVGDQAAFEISVAENAQRLPPTPVEEFRVFEQMARTRTPAEIAAHFGVTEKRVHQRLKLAALHPDVLAALDKGDITMEAAQAFTAGPVDKQQKYFAKNASNRWNLTPDKIKAAFTQKLVAGDSGLARLVGEAAYLAAGGEIVVDPFDDKPWWVNGNIVQDLVAQHWAGKIEAWRADGWAYVAEAKEYGAYFYPHHRVTPADMPLSPEGAAALAVARQRLLALHREFEFDPIEGEDEGVETPEPEGDEPSPTPEAESEIAELADVLASLLNNREYYTPEQKAGSGVVYWQDNSRPPALGCIDPKRATPPPEVKVQRETADLNALSYGGHEALTAAKKLAVRLAAQAAEPLNLVRILVAKLHAEFAKLPGHNLIPLSIGEESWRDLPAPGLPSRGESFPEVLDWTKGQDAGQLLEALAGFAAEALNHHGGAAENAAVESVVRLDAAAGFAGEAERYFKALNASQLAAAWKQITGEASGPGLHPKTVADEAIRTGWLPPQLRPADYAGPGAKKPKAVKAAKPEKTKAPAAAEQPAAEAAE